MSSYHNGKNNPRYIDGRTLKNHYCIDCGKKISLGNFFTGNQRCRKCASKKLVGISINKGKKNGNYKHGKVNNMFCLDCNKKIYYKGKRCKSCAQKVIKKKPLSKATKKKISKAHLGKKVTQETINKIKKSLHRHHIDLNTNNNKSSNILILSNGNHGRLHRYGYHYLIKIGKVKNYIKWFLKKYGDGR